LFDATPWEWQRLILGAAVVLVLLTIRYWRVMPPWEGIVLLVVLGLHF